MRKTVDDLVCEVAGFRPEESQDFVPGISAFVWPSLEFVRARGATGQAGPSTCAGTQPLL